MSYYALFRISQKNSHKSCQAADGLTKIRLPGLIGGFTRVGAMAVPLTDGWRAVGAAEHRLYSTWWGYYLHNAQVEESVCVYFSLVCLCSYVFPPALHNIYIFHTSMTRYSLLCWNCR